MSPAGFLLVRLDHGDVARGSACHELAAYSDGGTSSTWPAAVCALESDVSPNRVASFLTAWRRSCQKLPRTCSSAWYRNSSSAPKVTASSTSDNSTSMSCASE